MVHLMQPFEFDTTYLNIDNLSNGILLRKEFETVLGSTLGAWVVSSTGYNNYKISGSVDGKLNM